eukprot:CAMPEP_0183535636 /NCGR_PEP_ID=MMETSP0371-20130417/27696_1 /TAXON_ID=268820 /ORGANISM="Peridinium aciculiferum, Strain PAER-2" /LENGTH=123 /DNA_ID=CAMNT_0025736123 /DNA_START=17 /DNA_END=385 /DNA_ORIENTATION=-
MRPNTFMHWGCQHWRTPSMPPPKKATPFMSTTVSTLFITTGEFFAYSILPLTFDMSMSIGCNARVAMKNRNSAPFSIASFRGAATGTAGEGKFAETWCLPSVVSTAFKSMFKSALPIATGLRM